MDSRKRFTISDIHETNDGLMTFVYDAASHNPLMPIAAFWGEDGQERAQIYVMAEEGRIYVLKEDE